MFEPLPEESLAKTALSGAWKVILQGVLVYPLVFLLMKPALEIGRDPSRWSRLQPAFTDMGLVLVGGAVLGAAVGRAWPALTRTGRWLWLPPAVFLLGGVTTQRLNPPPIAQPSEYFYATPANEGLAVFLITLPTFCLFGYALGLWVGLRIICAARGAAAQDAKQR